MTNEQLLARGGDILKNMGIPDATGRVKKDSGTILSETENFGGIMPKPAVLDMINLTYKQNAWLAELDNIPVTSPNGYVPVFDLTGNVSEMVGENDGTQIRRKPTLINAPYAVKMFKADYSVTLKQLQDAETLGFADFEQKIAEAIATAIGNDKANLIMNGNTALNALTSMNRLLRAFDGLGILCDSANVISGGGKAFDKGMFNALLQNMPEPYRSQPNLRWWCNTIIDAKWREKIATVATGLGDQSLTRTAIEPPLGRQPMIVPQISDVQGPTAIAPTASPTDKTTYINFVLTTLVTAGHVATAAAGAGRLFKVTCKTTGISETCTGVLDTTLQINTAGLLGQTTVSTTASDYEVGLCDETDVYLGDPKSVKVIDLYEMEWYREFNKDFRRWDIVIYWHTAVVIPVLTGIVKAKRVAVTPTSTW